MTTSNVYKQSVYDNRAILLSVSVIEDGSLNSKKYNNLLINICQQFDSIKVHSSTNCDDELPLKRIYFNFKRNYTLGEKIWENFQIHHRAVGLMFIGEFKCGMDLTKILKAYAIEKDKGIGIVLESRLILIYDENTEDMVRNIRQTLSWDEEILSSDDTGEGNNIHYAINDMDCELELSIIKDSLLQSDIIWYHKSLIGGCRASSTSSLTDSISSGCSSAWKASSQNSETSISNPLKSISLLSDPGNEIQPHGLNCPESRQIYSFLKAIHDKLFTSLLNRESALTSKTEQTMGKFGTMETSSDSGSTMSLDDLDFNLTDPLDIDQKRFQDENKLNKTNRSRHYLGRLAKQTGDYAMLVGNYWQAYHYYQLSICYLKKFNNDQLWFGGAEEGLCCAWIAYNFDNKLNTFDSQLVETLHGKCRQAFTNQLKVSLNQPTTPIDVIPSQSPSPNVDQIDLSFLKKFSSVDLFKNPPEIQSLDDLNERYLSSISRYKKVLKPKAESLHPINMDACIKASRFFIDRHRYLEASNFLKLIKSDLSPDTDNERYHNTLARLYSQMGFVRKSIVHKYQMVAILQTKLDSVIGGPLTKPKLSVSGASPKQKIIERKLAIIIDILGSLGLDVSHVVSAGGNVDDRSVQIIDNGRDQEFESLKIKMVSELFLTCKSLNLGINTLVGLGLSLLDNWFGLITKIDCQRLMDDVNTFCRSETNKSSKLSGKICEVKHLPRLKKVIPTKLSNHLLPKQKEKPTDSKSIFIYTPLSVGGRIGRNVPPDPVVWVCGEECELVLLFDNPLPVSMQVSGMQMLLHNADCDLWLAAESSSIHLLSPNSRNIHCHFVIVPSRDLIPVGEYRITSISYQIPSVYNVTFYPHKSVLEDILQPLNTPSINIYPMLPQLKIFTSLPEQNLVGQKAKGICPPNTVMVSSATVYDNEVFEFPLFLSNESKEVDIGRITSVLDELELSSVSTMLVSRVSDDEFNNRQRSTFRMLSLVQENILTNLTIKSIFSMNGTLLSDGNRGNPPTDVVIKCLIDLTDREFNKELFEKISLSKTDSSVVEPLWNGQFRVTFRYSAGGDCVGDGDDVSSNSDVDTVLVGGGNEEQTASLYRESVVVVNCQVMLGLALVGYRVDMDLDLVLTLMNFSENKMEVDVYWRGSKVNLHHIVIVPNCGQISQYNNNTPLKRLSSTECSSHILNYRISSEIADLKSLCNNGSGCSVEELTNYIQSNLKISWTMKDKSLDKIRQGTVNLNWCICHFGRELLDLGSKNQEFIAHGLDFDIGDIIKILLWQNVILDINAFTEEPPTDSPKPPISPLDCPISINILECVQYHIRCSFLLDHWADNISEEVLRRIILRCVVTPTRISHISDSSSEDDSFKFQLFEFGGNSTLRFDKETVSTTELRGLVLFLVTGVYTIHSQLLIMNDQMHCCHGAPEVLCESSKYEVHVA